MLIKLAVGKLYLALSSCPGTGTGEQGPDSRKDGEWLKKCVAHYMYM